MSPKSLGDLGLVDEALPTDDLDNLPEIGSFAPPLTPGSYRFKFPGDMTQIFELIDKTDQRGQGLKLVFDRDHPLLVVSAANGKHLGEPFETRLTSIPRKRDKAGTMASDVDYLLKSQEIKQRPASLRALAQLIQTFGGKEFAGDIEYSWSCNDQKPIRVADPNGSGQKIVVESQMGCGQKYYMKDVPNNPDGTKPLEINCQCGAIVRGFANLTNIRK